MRDEIIKITLWVAVIAVTLFVTFMFMRLGDRVDQCKANGGLTVKTPEGWHCLTIKDGRLI